MDANQSSPVKILQIVACPAGWRAAFAEGDPHDPRYVMRAVACWALVERQGVTEIVGLSGWQKLEVCPEVFGFLGYQEPAKQDDDTMQDWRGKSRIFFNAQSSSSESPE